MSLLAVVEERLGGGPIRHGEVRALDQPGRGDPRPARTRPGLEHVFLNLNTPAAAERAGILLRAPFLSAGAARIPTEDISRHSRRMP